MLNVQQEKICLDTFGCINAFMRAKTYTSNSHVIKAWK